MHRFASYDTNKISGKPGVTDCGDTLHTQFLGGQVVIKKADGTVTVDGKRADFNSAMSVFDWLCDGKADAAAFGRYAPVSSLPGVLVSGNGLMMDSPSVAEMADQQPEKLRTTLLKMGAREISIGDMGFEVPLFPGICLRLKFYFRDEEFAPSVTFLWDENILQFVRYETVYYIAGAITKKLLQK